MFGVIAVSGAPRRWLVGLALAGVAVAAARGRPAGVLKDYQIDRFMAFTNPALDPRGAGYNTEQARIAIGNGGRVRSGAVPRLADARPASCPSSRPTSSSPWRGRSSAWSAPELLIVLLGRGDLAGAGASRPQADDLFGRLAAAGIACWFGFQAFQNIGMCLGIMPVTGVPLPLVSYGGSSMFATLMALGLLQNIHLRTQRSTGLGVAHSRRDRSRF